MTPLVVSPRRALVVFALLAAIVLVEFWIVDAPNRYVLSGWVTFLVFATGASTLFVGERERQLAQLRRAHEEIEGLATIAERERIARDLHDLLGHTLSVIVLKSELASKVAQADPARAVAEIRDVERISREALSEVRAAVAGYHSHGFAGELERARHVLATSGVALAVELEPVRMPPKRESVLALVLREAVTNIVRHARASHCHVSLRGDGDGLVLTVRDNGVGGVHPGGSGLAGMHERVRAAGGRLDIDGTRGVTIEVRLPPREGAAA
jgi:two-component system sensor histidine kinase DesK